METEGIPGCGLGTLRDGQGKGVLRVQAERICVLTAKELIMGRKEKFFRGSDYVRMIKQNGEKMRKETGIL